MSRARRNQHSVPRTARLSELLREVIADELSRIDDERLELVAITAIDVDAELNRAIVFFDPLEGADADEVVRRALADHRVRLQAAIGRQVRARKTPVLDFRPDEVIRAAERIDEILRREPPPPEREPEPFSAGERSLDDQSPAEKPETGGR